MIQTLASISPYGLGIAKRVERYVVVAAKFVARLKGRWYE
jgi:hypothetical protein